MNLHSLIGMDELIDYFQDDENDSEFVKSGFSKANLLVDSSFRLIADDLSPSAAGQSLPSESVISISNAYSKQFYDMTGNKLPQKLNGQDEEMILDQQGRIIEQEKDRKKEKSYNYPRATPGEIYIYIFSIFLEKTSLFCRESLHC